ncbi:MAG: glutamate--tRNA ligase family protein, partial [Sulfitobacter sp.]
PQFGPDGLVYPGTCADNMLFERKFPEQYPLPENAVLRLDMTLAVACCGAFVGGADVDPTAHFTETGAGPNAETGQIAFSQSDLVQGIGDIVLARRDMGTSYHLSVVLDDAAQGITHVVRGEDLFEATKIHVVLQKLLGLPTPIYHHHKLIRDEQGKRLAKRYDARAISLYRNEGATPKDIRSMIGL